MPGGFTLTVPVPTFVTINRGCTMSFPVPVEPNAHHARVSSPCVPLTVTWIWAGYGPLDRVRGRIGKPAQVVGKVMVPVFRVAPTVPWISQPTPAATTNPLSETSLIGKFDGRSQFTVNTWPSFAAARLCGRTPVTGGIDIVIASAVVAPRVAVYVCAEPDAGFTVKP